MVNVPIMAMAEFDDFLRASQVGSASRYSHSPGGSERTESDEGYPYELDDIYFLYSLARKNAAVSVMEFGSGWSTLAFAKAVHENKLSMEKNYNARHPNPFQVMTIDAAQHWMDVSLQRIPAELRELVVPQVTSVELVSYQGSVASAYSELPPFTPDIIYLDGPDAEQVGGNVGGFVSIKRHGLPMSTDILFIEPHLWPWTLIVTDGRTANARFLKTHLRRNWQFLHDPFGDRSIFRLDETPFGQIGEEHIESRLRVVRGSLNKQDPFPV